MRQVAFVVGSLGVAMLVASQTFNLMSRRWRWRLGGPGAVAVLLGLAGAPPEHRGWLAAGLGVALLGLNQKWVSEIQGDMAAREIEGLPPLLPRRRQWLLHADPSYMFRYRRKMFVDSWSRRRVEAISVAVPR